MLSKRKTEIVEFDFGPFMVEEAKLLIFLEFVEFGLVVWLYIVIVISMSFRCYVILF